MTSILPSSDRRSGWWLLLILPAAFLVGTISEHLQFWHMGLLLVAVSWICLRFIIAPALRGSVKGWDKASDIKGALRQILSETILLGWIIIAFSGRDWSDGLTPTLSGGVKGLLLSIISWWEGDAKYPISSRARLAVAILTVITHYKKTYSILIDVHDHIITDLIVNCPLDLRVALPASGLLIFGAMVFFLLGHNLLWQRKPLNQLAIRLLDRYFKKDPRGLRYAKLAHIGHRFTDKNSLTRRLWTFCLGIWRLLIGRPPVWFTPPRVGQTRYEQFVRNRLHASEQETLLKSRKWRAMHMQNLPMVVQSHPLREAAHKQINWLLVLGDCLICPDCSRVLDLSCERLQELTEYYERLLITMRRLNSAEGNEVDFESNEVFHEAVKRLKRYYRVLDQKTDDHSLKDMIVYRIESLEKPDADDVNRLGWRTLLLERVRDQERSELFVHTLFTEFWIAEDWAGLIEVKRLLHLNTSYELTMSDHLNVGEAYFHYSIELGNGDLGRWCQEKAIRHFYQAKSKEHLKVLLNS
jgi:hypothetical protein